ncbi:unnamed protein product [Miscanthus lutarioriparius]|uniref:Uncharacterized protein n=1 Tax=Miscanthus lutarioriparius TaxID=422564 RepID=A0A811R190_9POAL|nr:unnamed protein product [Miscanthus lutarioriparius]
MKSSRAVVLVLLLAIAMASCRLSLAAHDHESSTSIAAILGRDLRGFIARAGNLFRSDGGAWRAANVTATDGAEAKNLRAVAASRRRRPSARKSAGSGGSGAGCVSAAACRKRRVICGKRCYDGASASRAASLNHVPSRCVVKCRKCVPTC